MKDSEKKTLINDLNWLREQGIGQTLLMKGKQQTIRNYAKAKGMKLEFFNIKYDLHRVFYVGLF